jgi:hypothetical protein
MRLSEWRLTKTAPLESMARFSTNEEEGQVATVRTFTGENSPPS